MAVIHVHLKARLHGRVTSMSWRCYGVRAYSVISSAMYDPVTYMPDLHFPRDFEWPLEVPVDWLDEVRS